MDITHILLAALTVVMTFAFGVVLAYLRSLSKKIDRAEDRAEVRAAEDRARAAEDRARAAEDRAANKADHDKLFQLVAGLQADVKVLRDRSDRSGRAERSDRSDSAG